MRVFNLLLVGCLVGACSVQPQGHLPGRDARLATAEALIDAFYAFDPARLRTAMSGAPTSIPTILYYQGWAQGGN